MEAGLAVTEGIHRVDSDVDVQIRPLADGGRNVVALIAGMNGMKQEIQVTQDHLEHPVVCEYGIIKAARRQ